MISWFRAFTKSPIAIVLFALLLVSFAVFGISDVFNAGPVRDAVVQAGSRTVSGAQFKQVFDGYRRQLEQQNQGRAISTEEAVENGVDRRVVENLAYTESFAELVQKMGLRPSDQQVVDEIGKLSAFFDQISGRFDRTVYQQRLREAGLTEAQFESQLRDDIAQNQLVSGLAAALTAPRAYGAAVAVFNREGRNVQWFAVEPSDVEQPTMPTDAQLTAYIKQNAARFTRPETRQFTLLRFSAAMTAPSITVNPADVQKRFEFERDSLSTPERRTVVQVPAKDAATANAAAERLRRGEDAAAVAKSLGVQPVVFTDSPKTAIPDRQIADAAFSMKQGEVRAVQGGIGQAVVQVQSVTPGKVPTLEEVRPRIEEQVRRDAAVERVYDLVQKYEQARSGGANLAEAAKAVGVEPVAVPVAVTAQGQTMDGRQANLPPQLLESLFALPQGGESEVESAAEGEYFAIRVDKVNPSGLFELSEIREPAQQVYMMEELRKRMQARADELAARVRKGEAADVVARTIGASVSRVADLRRDGAGQSIGRATLEAVFQAKPGETVVVSDEQGLVVARIESVVPGDPAEMAKAVEAQRTSLAQIMFSDMGLAARNYARDVIEPKIDFARARTALGLEAPAAPAAGGAPAAPAGTKQ